MFIKLCYLWLRFIWMFASITSRKSNGMKQSLEIGFDWCYNSRALITTIRVCARVCVFACIFMNCYYYNGWWLSICCQWVIYGCSPQKPKLYITTTTITSHTAICANIFTLWLASANVNECVRSNACACVLFERLKENHSSVFSLLRINQNKCEHKQND